MTEYGNVRISSDEREAALAELATQFSEGRLAADEFASRSEAIITAVVRHDLTPIFADLPVVLPTVLQSADKRHQSAEAATKARRARLRRDQQLGKVFNALRMGAMLAFWGCAFLLVLSGAYHWLYPQRGGILLTAHGWMVATVVSGLAFAAFAIAKAIVERGYRPTARD